MKPAESLCLYLNKLFPPKERSYRNSPEKYVEIQYEWAKISLSYFEGYVNLEGKDILDAGCSLGGKTLFFSERKPRSLVGVDIDPVRIKYAREISKKNNKNVTFKLANLATLPFKDSSFDLIFMDDVVEHVNITLLKKVLTECKRVLRSDGKVCLEFPPWESHDASHFYDYIRIPWCQVFFTDETLVSVVQQLPQVLTFGHQDSIEHYKELNRITIPEFEKYVQQSGLRFSLKKRRMIKNISLLKYIPFFNKYFTTRAIYILEK